jgi:cyclophilin family peptidyl-prolyl cis-trans isomerase
MNENLKIILGIVIMVILIVIFSMLVIENKSNTDLDTDHENTTDLTDNTEVSEKKENEVETMNPIVIMETSKGNIEIELYPEKAPITVANFLEYVDSNFYSNLIFHRVISGFMIQGGGFESNGSQKQTKSPIKLETNKGLSNLTGTIAMARTKVLDSATSQFFINTVDNLGLDYSTQDPGYAVFGKVISGMDVVYEIEKVETTTKSGHENWPVEDVVILKVYRK